MPRLKREYIGTYTVRKIVAHKNRLAEYGIRMPADAVGAYSIYREPDGVITLVPQEKV